MKLKGGPPRFCSRRRSKTCSSSHHARISSSRARWSGYWGRASNIASILGTEETGVPKRCQEGTTRTSVKKGPNVYSCHRTELRAGSAAERQAGDRRLLGGMVRPVPRRLARARQDRRRAQRRPEARQGQHRRGAGARDALRRSVDPDDDPLQGRRADRSCRRRAAEDGAREGARPSFLATEGAQAPSALSFSACGTGATARSAGSSTRLRTRIPCTYTIAPPSQPPPVRHRKPTTVSAYAPPLTFASR